jgi:hypothetical protein
LWVVLAVDRERVGVSESANNAAIDEELEAFGVPVDTISVPGILRSGDIVVNDTVIGGGIGFACGWMSALVALR